MLLRYTSAVVTLCVEVVNYHAHIYITIYINTGSYVFKYACRNSSVVDRLQAILWLTGRLDRRRNYINDPERGWLPL